MKNLLKFFVGTLLILGIVSCSNSSGGSVEVEPQPLSSLPVIQPPAGDYSEGFKNISISHDSSSADIFYTTDGTDPTESSSRYTGEFKIIGSATVKAVAVSGKSKSRIATAKYNLNAGKSKSQLGVVTGTVGISSNLSESVKENLKNATVYIYSDDIPGVVKQCKVGEEFIFDGLDTAKSYSFYFSNTQPSVFAESKTARAATEKDEYGRPLVSLKLRGVQPQEGSGTDLATVELDSTGTIKGVAKRYDVAGNVESDHSGISVFIPGTSYSAFTDSDGSFAISGVPQGLHTIRATYSGYTFAEKENILLKATAENEDENKTIKSVINEEFALYFGKGIAGGTVILSDSDGVNGNEGVSIVMYDTTGKYSYTGSTSTNGRWQIVDIYPGRYTIEISKTGYVAQTLTDIEIKGASSYTVPTISLQIIGGKITGSASVLNYAEKAGISIIAENENGKKYYAVTDTDGDFTVEPVSPGLYTVTASFAGYKSVSYVNIPVSLGANAFAGNFELSEKAAYSVTGNVVLEGMDSGFEGISVLLTDTTNAKKTYSTTTNVEGSWSVSDIDAGTYVVTVSKSGFITEASVSVYVGLTSIARADNIVLRSSAGTVTGNITLEGSDDCSGISILVKKENDSTKSYTTVTDTAGHFAVAGVTHGTYRVQATKGGYVTGISDPFSVSSGMISEINTMQLKVSLRSIMGKVTLEARTDFTGVRITATKTTSTTEIYSALSNKDGLYVLSGMTPGEYILMFAF